MLAYWERAGGQESISGLIESVKHWQGVLFFSNLCPDWVESLPIEIPSGRFVIATGCFPLLMFSIHMHLGSQRDPVSSLSGVQFVISRSHQLYMPRMYISCNCTEDYYILHTDPSFDHLLRLGFEFGDVRKCHVPRPALPE